MVTCTFLLMVGRCGIFDDLSIDILNYNVLVDDPPDLRWKVKNVMSSSQLDFQDFYSKRHIWHNLNYTHFFHNKSGTLTFRNTVP